MSENLQTAAAGAALFAFSVILAAGLWFADHPGPARTPQPARTATVGAVRWDTALTNEIGAPARAPYALCAVWRGERVGITDTRDVDGRRHFLATTADGCAGWISDEALDQY